MVEQEIVYGAEAAQEQHKSEETCEDSKQFWAPQQSSTSLYHSAVDGYDMQSRHTASSMYFSAAEGCESHRGQSSLYFSAVDGSHRTQSMSFHAQSSQIVGSPDAEFWAEESLSSAFGDDDEGDSAVAAHFAVGDEVEDQDDEPSALERTVAEFDNTPLIDPDSPALSFEAGPAEQGHFALSSPREVASPSQQTAENKLAAMLDEVAAAQPHLSQEVHDREQVHADVSHVSSASHDGKDVRGAQFADLQHQQDISHVETDTESEHFRGAPQELSSESQGSVVSPSRQSAAETLNEQEETESDTKPVNTNNSEDLNERRQASTAAGSFSEAEQLLQIEEETGLPQILEETEEGPKKLDASQEAVEEENKVMRAQTAPTNNKPADAAPAATESEQAYPEKMEENVAHSTSSTDQTHANASAPEQEEASSPAAGSKKKKRKNKKNKNAAAAAVPASRVDVAEPEAELPDQARSEEAAGEPTQTASEDSTSAAPVPSAQDAEAQHQEETAVRSSPQHESQPECVLAALLLSSAAATLAADAVKDPCADKGEEAASQEPEEQKADTGLEAEGKSERTDYEQEEERDGTDASNLDVAHGEAVEEEEGEVEHGSGFAGYVEAERAGVGVHEEESDEELFAACGRNAADENEEEERRVVSKRSIPMAESAAMERLPQISEDAEDLLASTLSAEGHEADSEAASGAGGAGASSQMSIPEDEHEAAAPAGRGLSEARDEADEGEQRQQEEEGLCSVDAAGAAEESVEENSGQDEERKEVPEEAQQHVEEEPQEEEEQHKVTGEEQHRAEEEEQAMAAEQQPRDDLKEEQHTNEVQPAESAPEASGDDAGKECVDSGSVAAAMAEDAADEKQVAPADPDDAQDGESTAVEPQAEDVVRAYEEKENAEEVEDTVAAAGDGVEEERKEEGGAVACAEEEASGGATEAPGVVPTDVKYEAEEQHVQTAAVEDAAAPAEDVVPARAEPAADAAGQEEEVAESAEQARVHIGAEEGEEEEAREEARGEDVSVGGEAAAGEDQPEPAGDAAEVEAAEPAPAPDAQDAGSALAGAAASEAASESEGGMTELHKAAARGDWAACAVLVASQANTAVRDDSWLTPLHHAARGGHVEVIHVLLGEGQADIESESRAGSTALHLAVVAGHEEAVRALVSHSSAEFLDHQDQDGQTPLHCAVGAPHGAAVAALLVAAGADAQRTDFSGMTPLLLAQQRGLPDVVASMAPTTPTTTRTPAAAAAGSAPCSGTAARSTLLAAAPEGVASSQRAEAVSELAGSRAAAEEGALVDSREKADGSRWAAEDDMLITGRGEVWIARPQVVGEEEEPARAQAQGGGRGLQEARQAEACEGWGTRTVLMGEEEGLVPAQPGVLGGLAAVRALVAPKPRAGAQARSKDVGFATWEESGEAAQEARGGARGGGGGGVDLTRSVTDDWIVVDGGDEFAGARAAEAGAHTAHSERLPSLAAMDRTVWEGRIKRARGAVKEVKKSLHQTFTSSLQALSLWPQGSSRTPT